MQDQYGQRLGQFSIDLCLWKLRMNLICCASVFSTFGNFSCLKNAGKSGGLVGDSGVVIVGAALSTLPRRV